jgi:asparagine synthase (glutamine-hydrolysing)
MCGIAGSWRSEWDVGAALDRIAHRGPDARAIVDVPEVVHGHVRLSIMDPEPRSNQPFVYGGVTLAYNGELWNAPELRHQLGHELFYGFETTGDTEVVAAALAEWGTDALSRMDGQFALAWTDAEGETWLARDRWGEVPLYMLEDGDRDGLFGAGVVWASERKAFGGRGAEAVPVPEGSYVRVATGEVGTYYGIGVPEPLRWDIRGEVEGSLRRGTVERLQSDVPVCTLLSGGLDSSAILALVKEQVPDVVAYTAYMPGEDSPDLEAARYVADHHGVELREVQVEPTLTAVHNAVSTVEIPMKTQVEIAVPCIRLADVISADGFKVVLSGEGADELFGGYGGLMRKATSDSNWIAARRYAFEKMARGNFVRTNKTFMAAGVEARLPFMDRGLVERVLALGLGDCPPGKKLLKEAVADIVPGRVVRRQKETFQGASGISGYLEQLLDGKQQVTYNAIARDLFGGLPRG